MAAPTDSVVLDLPALPEMCELARPVAETLGLAASVVVHTLHGGEGPDPAAIEGEGRSLSGELRRGKVDDRAIATFSDFQEATEWGAAGVAILTARQVLERMVFRRLPKGTGADYLMRGLDVTTGDDYERLESSGIAEGQEATTSRLASKIDQLARFPAQPRGCAIVTNFRGNPIDIRFRRWTHESMDAR